ncbi:winged helix-turn-helix transcriptional regulator [Hydrogenivirga sp.]
MEKTLLSCKWALQIIVNLVDSPKRPSELKRLINGIEERVLFDRLRRLLNAGLLYKRESQGYPKETYYILTEPERFSPLREWLLRLRMPIDRVVSVMSCRWTLEIMGELRKETTPKCLKEALTGLGDKTLHRRLNELESLGLVRRVVVPTKPVRVLYRLTETGEELLPLLRSMKELILCKERTRNQAPLPACGS